MKKEEASSASLDIRINNNNIEVKYLLYYACNYNLVRTILLRKRRAKKASKRSKTVNCEIKSRTLLGRCPFCLFYRPCLAQATRKKRRRSWRESEMAW